MHFRTFASLKSIFRAEWLARKISKKVFDTETIYLIFKNVNELSERILSRENGAWN